MLVRGSQGHVLSPDSVHYDLRVTPFHSCPLEIVFNVWWLSGPFMVALGAMPLYVALRAILSRGFQGRYFHTFIS